MQLGDAMRMSITKIVAMLIPIMTVVIWIYLFLMATEISLTRFLLVSVLVPAVLASFYIAILVWRKSKPKI